MILPRKPYHTALRNEPETVRAIAERLGANPDGAYVGDDIMNALDRLEDHIEELKLNQAEEEPE